MAVAPQPALAQPVQTLPLPARDYVGEPVVAVRLQLEGRDPADPRLLDLIETRPGAPLSVQAVRESIAHLMALGRFQDVQVHATAAGGGVNLVYDLVPLHSVRRIVFHGRLGLAERRLRRAVTDRYGTSPSVGRAPEIGRTLEDLYRDHGYLRAQVEPRAEVEHAPEGTTLVFEIDAGERARIGAITVDASPPVTPGPLLARLDLQPGNFYERQAISRRLARYADELRASGYYEATADHAASPTALGRTIDLTVRVRRGPRVRIEFTGDPLPPKDRDELVPVRGERSVDEDLLEDSQRRIDDRLRAQGYRDAEARYSPIDTGPDELRIVFDVRKGALYTIAAVDIVGPSSVPRAALDPFVRVRPGQPFIRSLFEADAAVLVDQYRRRGFAEAKVTPVVVDEPSTGDTRARRSVRLRYDVAEGALTRVGAVTLEGHRALTEVALRRAISLKTGEPFYRPQVAVDADALLRQYLDRGYQAAAVEPTVTMADGTSRADVRFTIREGPEVLVDHILIVGNHHTSSDTIERALLLKPGHPLGSSALIESQRRLSALGLFRRVRLTELRHAHGSATSRDLLVSVEEAPTTTIGYGGGLEGRQRLRRPVLGGAAVERLELAPRGFFEIGRRNLWGKNRSVNLSARAGLAPRDPSPRDPTLVSATDKGGYGFNEYRLLGVYREPRALGGADLLLTGLLEQAVRSSFNFSRRDARIELARRLTPTIGLSGRYGFGRIRLFDERIDSGSRADIDRLFPRVRLSTISASLVRDTRDDPVDPGVGTFVGLNTDVAGRKMGSEVGFAKTFVQGFWYRRVPGGRRAIFASGARLGVATGFPREVRRRAQDPTLPPVVTVVRDLPASERFFAGGDTTVRGFALDRLGARETFDRAGVPGGGHALLVFNAEVRVSVWRSLGAVGFVDAGNVFARVNDLDLGKIRGSVGVGIRYRSPVGPIRVDLGVKLDRRQFDDGVKEPRTALHISIGQAF